VVVLGGIVFVEDLLDVVGVRVALVEDLIVELVRGGRVVDLLDVLDGTVDRVEVRLVVAVGVLRVLVVARFVVVRDGARVEVVRGLLEDDVRREEVVRVILLVEVVRVFDVEAVVLGGTVTLDRLLVREEIVFVLVLRELVLGIAVVVLLLDKEVD
jgi:hypothetical protein